MSSSKTLLAIPTYNEALNVEPICRALLGLDADFDLLFMDDASPDGTGAIIDRLANENSRVRTAHRQGKLGIGSAHLDCIAYAYDHDYDVLITMDCDFTHPPEYIPEVIAKSNDCDIVIGSRYIIRDSLNEWSVQRRLMTYGAHLLTRYLLKLEHDASSGLRLYKLRRIPRDLFSLVDGRGYSFFFESLYVLTKHGLKVGEVGIKLPARATGQSKMGIREAADGLLRLGKLWASCTFKTRKPPVASQ